MLKKMLKYLREGRTPSPITWGLIGLVIFSVIAAIGIMRAQVEIKEKTAKLNQIEEKFKEQTAENEALKELLSEGTDEYIERRAREDLDMVLPGERVYIIRAGS